MATASAVAKLAAALMKAGDETLLCAVPEEAQCYVMPLVPMWNLHFAGHMRGDTDMMRT
jgi:hypothetical protein